MKRDMDLVREILFCAEKDEQVEGLAEKYGHEMVAGHVAILIDAGMVDARVVPNGMGIPSAAHIIRLTWAGHEFLDNARDNALWKKTLKFIGSKVSSVSFAVLTECLKEQALQLLKSS